MAEYKDYYKILGVSRDAGETEIKSAYRKLAKLHHPDKNKGDTRAADKFKDISEAYEVLGDGEKKKMYDQYGQTGGIPQGAGFSGAGSAGVAGGMGDMGGGGFSDFFQQFFGGAGPRSGGMGGGNVRMEDLLGSGIGGRAAPQNVTGEIQISLREAFESTSRAVTIQGRKLEVKIPAGTKAGSKLRLSKQAPGGADVILTITLERDPIFTLEGDDIKVSVEIPVLVAVLGGKHKVPTLGGNVELNIPAGSSSGRTLRLRGQGWPTRTGRGDQLVRIEIHVPKTLSSEEKVLYEQLEGLRIKA